jgi:hypothetical protein
MTKYDRFCCLSYTKAIVSLKFARRFRAKKPPRPSQEAAVNEIIDTQPLNLKTYFLTIDSTDDYSVGIDPP